MSTGYQSLSGRVPVNWRISTSAKVAWDHCSIEASLAGTLPMERPGGNDLPFVYSGTLITQGQGIAQVQATGMIGGQAAGFLD